VVQAVEEDHPARVRLALEQADKTRRRPIAAPGKHEMEMMQSDTYARSTIVEYAPV
jgi:hypothetical protein